MDLLLAFLGGCSVTDKFGNHRSCTTKDPEILDTILMINDTSSIVFFVKLVNPEECGG
jgi:hypothetical protein